MSKTITVASKFTEEELDKIDYFVAQNKTTRSALFHELVMNGVNGVSHENEAVVGNTNIREVMFRFTDDFAYFWKGREYKGIINGENASVYIGGEWKNYPFKDLPVIVVEQEV